MTIVEMASRVETWAEISVSSTGAFMYLSLIYAKTHTFHIEASWGCINVYHNIIYILNASEFIALPVLT